VIRAACDNRTAGLATRQASETPRLHVALAGDRQRAETEMGREEKTMYENTTAEQRENDLQRIGEARRQGLSIAAIEAMLVQSGYTAQEAKSLVEVAIVFLY